MPTLAESLLSRIQDHSATVGIIGMGYVGLPLALAFAEKGFPVLGFDVDQNKVEKLNRGEGYIKHLEGSRIAQVRDAKHFEATTDFARLSEADAILICVPTPLTPQREPDMTYVDVAARHIHAALRPGQLIILESTTYPGTTDERLLAFLDGEHTRKFPIASPEPELRFPSYFLAFSPEREDPGRKDFTTTTTPKVVGGVDKTSGDLAQALYDEIVTRTVRVSSARAAEATKLVENIFRAVNIALVNELKIIYDRMGIDVWEVLDAAETKPFGFMRFNPGPGWGGHCIPLDPFYLSWKAKEFGSTARFIELAGEINVKMPEYVIEKLTLALNDRQKSVKGSKILLLGMAYKKDIDDPRESPAFEIMELLQTLGAEVAYHDPHIPEIGPTRRHRDKRGLRSVRLSPEVLGAHDAVLLVTDHTSVDYDMVLQHAQLIVDTRNVIKGASEKLVRA